METTTELERLQSELASRQSTLCFAHTGIALTAAVIFASAAGKLFWDSRLTPILGYIAATVALGLTVFAVTRYLRGRTLLREEVARFERMMALRRELGLDDPSKLLPTR